MELAGELVLVGGVAGADIEPGLPDSSIACSNHYSEWSECRDLRPVSK